VYVLCDPRTEAIRYVGITFDPERRLWQHRSQAPNDAAALWFEEMRAAGVRVEMCLIDWVPVRQRLIAERRWITHFGGAGHDLLNIRGSTDPQKVRELGPWRQAEPGSAPSILMRIIELERGKPMIELIRPLVEAGKSWAAVAQALEVSPVTLQKWRQQVGIRRVLIPTTAVDETASEQSYPIKQTCDRAVSRKRLTGVRGKERDANR